MLHKSVKISIFYLIFAIFMSSYAYSGGFTHLPRNFGPFEVGMSTSEFTDVTGIKPEACPICIKNESFATMDADQLSRFDNTDTGGDGADFFFYGNKLYHISAGPEVKDLFLAKQEYEMLFGGPGTTIDQGNGSAIVKWEDSGTVITLNYRPDQNEVFSLNFFDWNLKEERDWRESIALEQNLSKN